MFPKINPTHTLSWTSLSQHYHEIKNHSIRSFFLDNPKRFEQFSIEMEDLFFDFSKNHIDQNTINLLIALAHECQLDKAIHAMFAGEKINETENRAVLHTALRNFSNQPVLVDGKNVMPAIRSVQSQMRNFCESVQSGEWKGMTGHRIKNIVNIGIGGSDLGPVMVTEALKPYWLEGLTPYFISNVDPVQIAEILSKINADETLFIIASKTFTTQETMINAFTAREWFLKSGGTEKDIAKHFVAVSTNKDAVHQFGISINNIFEFWDWVGGRFSLWSAIGLSISLIIGYDRFEDLLKGAHFADHHFATAPFEKNIPVLMGLIGIWHRNFFKAPTEAILPYDQYLHRFPAYFQQANMESNGKTVDRNGLKIAYETGPVIWGEPGTNGQHAFYQLIHQGSQLVPCDFIVAAQSQKPLANHHQILISNFFAQTEALMNGDDQNNLFKLFEGNRPSNSIIVKKITPFTLGQLIALYEHKIFVQGVIWNIYSFDQWGVELGKKLAKKIMSELVHPDDIHTHDSSTNGLINMYKKYRKS